ncbi:MAG: AAA family ATPase, partial [Planctomycetota bacterium]|nr:AAA family ATPase [Planctomycetota bacterium]
NPTHRLILIVDEIEEHLHPKWQRTILPAIMAVAESLQPQIHVQIFAATHSPLVLASLEPGFDTKTDKLFWLNFNQGKVEFQDYPWAIQGDVVGWLTSEIFGLQQARSKEAEEAIEAAEAFLRGELKDLPAGLKTKTQIQAGLEKVLPGIDPFWPRWVVETEQ